VQVNARLQYCGFWTAICVYDIAILSPETLTMSSHRNDRTIEILRVFA